MHHTRHHTSRRRRRLLATTAAVQLTTLLLVAGCTGGSGLGSGGGGGAAESAMSSGSRADAQVAGPAGAPAEASRAADLLRREVIQRADLRVRARDVGSALVRVRRIVGDAQGVVAEERTGTGRRGEPVRSTLTLRVPAAAFETVLADLAGLGRLGAQRVSTEDVSAQVVDVEARILSARRTIERLRELLEAADDFSDILSLEAELARREADLASLEAQQAYLEDQTSLSTITLTLLPLRPGTGDDEDVTGFVGGLSVGWDALAGLVAVVLTALGVLLPLLVVLLPAALLTAWLLRRVLRRRPSQHPAPADQPPA